MINYEYTTLIISGSHNDGKISNQSDLSKLSEMLDSGWEIHNSASQSSPSEYRFSPIIYVLRRIKLATCTNL